MDKDMTMFSNKIIILLYQIAIALTNSTMKLIRGF